MNDHHGDDREDFPLSLLRGWHSFGSPVGLAVLLVGLGTFLFLLAEAIAVPLSLFR